MYSATDRAYLAGLIDGEGHIGIITLATPGGRKRHTLVLTITNTHISTLHELAELWTGSVVGVRKRKDGWSEVADLRWSAQRAAATLREVQPFLRIKQEQCRIALRFIDLMNPLERRSWFVSDELWQQREDLRMALSHLNGRRAVRLDKSPTKPALTCQWCGKAFDSYQKLRKYCSQDCAMKAGRAAYIDRTTVARICADCGAPFSTARKNQLYCSRQCGPHGHRNRGLPVMGTRAVPYVPRAKRPKPTKPCPICGTDFVPNTARQQTCSVACGLTFRAGRLKKPPVTRQCLRCGGTFAARTNTKTETGYQEYCSPACASYGRWERRKRSSAEAISEPRSVAQAASARSNQQ